MTTPRIGFVGLGMMGHGMAKNIVEKGFALTVIAHRKREAVEDLIGRGAKEARSLAELAAASDVVVICVTGSPQVEAVIRGESGLAARLAPGSLVIDTSTADPTSTLALAAELEARGITFIDAPLSRTPAQAWEGKLETMVGGTDEEFARAEPVIAAYADRILHVGPLGAGHTLKLVNNFIAMSYGAVYAEALTVARKAGITPKTLDTWMRGTRMYCAFYDTFMRAAVDGEAEAFRFGVANALKDMRYLEALANRLGVLNPVGNAVKNTYALAIAQGRGDGYVPVIAKAVAQVNGLEPT